MTAESKPTKKMLVVGGLGACGRALVHHLEGRDDWEVYGLSRRKPDFSTTAKWINCDLLDPDGCRRALEGSNFTHVAYCAVLDKPSMVSGWSENDHAEMNTAMLRNILFAAEAVSTDLRHVTLMQGTKAYGKHLGPHRNPARETDARYMPPNFYYDQEDFLRERSKTAGWSWSGFRPQSVWTPFPGGNANFIIAAGVYAAISRELGLPLRYPGTLSRIYEATDARLIAKAIEWAGTDERCSGEIYNITNGDVLVWDNLWPGLAKAFDMELGHPQKVQLHKVMPAHGAVWDKVVRDHRLVPFKYDAMVPSWEYIDFALGTLVNNETSHVSTIKIRQHGFGECVDSEDLFSELIAQAQEQRYLPR